MYFYRCTEDKLDHHIERIEGAGDTVVQAVYKGGRDWGLFCRRAGEADPLTRAVEAGVRAGVRKALDAQRPAALCSVVGR